MKSDSRTELLLAAISYADRLQWPVVPGVRCDGQGGCPSLCAGRSAAASDGRDNEHGPAATRDVRMLVDWWSRFPDACVLSPAGYSFDAVSIPKLAGREVLSRITANESHGWAGIAAEGRMVFLLKTGLAYQLRIRLGRHLGNQELRIYDAGDLIALPPSHGTTWINVEGAFASLSEAPGGLLPALASASARHARQPRPVGSQAFTHVTNFRIPRAPQSAGSAVDPFSCRRSRLPILRMPR